ncbi:hypothetical protein PM10SUCC1_09490 [Propionigenium maris DSM 9537]|uniref:Uncharacterized protein n=1 Tax=Propionigenium maris DSM 9537 TaxID=1123000 RepID=A0A9W6GJS2_9FUSO|nr:hypothetical protein [Propionigenium maris]GLI55435.1 hypothetical protein PM10SUCC1_09490 [Propionigenium maris DSM 9537]
MNEKIIVDLKKLLACKELRLIDGDRTPDTNEVKYDFTDEHSLQLKVQKDSFNIVHSLLSQREYKITGSATYPSGHYIWLDFDTPSIP